MKKLKDQYIHNLTRIDKADKYFKSLSDKDIENIDESKAYKALEVLIHDTNEIYNKLIKQGIEVPVI